MLSPFQNSEIWYTRTNETVIVRELRAWSCTQQALRFQSQIFPTRWGVFLVLLRSLFSSISDFPHSWSCIYFCAQGARTRHGSIRRSVQSSDRCWARAFHWGHCDWGFQWRWKCRKRAGQHFRWAPSFVSACVWTFLIMPVCLWFGAHVCQYKLRSMIHIRFFPLPEGLSAHSK